MTLNIISAKEIVFTGEVNSVTLPGAMGEFTVLNNHAALIAVLTSGRVRYTDSTGTEHTADIPGGIADVDKNVVSVSVN